MSAGAVPPELRYTKSHEWVRTEGDETVVGITDHAQQELTDIVFVDLPKVGTEVTAGASALVLESVKTVADVYAPCQGTSSPSTTRSSPTRNSSTARRTPTGGCSASSGRRVRPRPRPSPPPSTPRSRRPTRTDRLAHAPRAARNRSAARSTVSGGTGATGPRVASDSTAARIEAGSGAHRTTPGPSGP